MVDMSATLSARGQQLLAAPRATLERMLRDGAPPTWRHLEGWQFRGANHPRAMRALGLRKFAKSFVSANSSWAARQGNPLEPAGPTLGYGYNHPMVQNPDAAPWQTNGAPFGDYRVTPVNPCVRDNQYLHALLLDYGACANRRAPATRLLRDYVVALDARCDLLLGKAYAAIGNQRLPLTYFVLERWRQVNDPSSAMRGPERPAT